MAEKERRDEESNQNPPKKDWSRVNKMYEEWQKKHKEGAYKEEQQSDVDKILSGERVEKLNQVDQDKLKEQLKEEKLVSDEQIAKLRIILDKIHRGETLTDEERKTVKGS